MRGRQRAAGRGAVVEHALRQRPREAARGVGERRHEPRRARQREREAAVAELGVIAAARALGDSTGAILFRTILPNIVAPLTVIASFNVASVILTEASLSFLGLGIQPPYADLGGMVRENAAAINFGMMAPIYPATAIALLTVSVNLVVDWMLSIDARPSGAQAEL